MQVQLKYLLTFLLSAVAVFQAGAQTVNVKGRITDSSGEGVVAATV